MTVEFFLGLIFFLVAFFISLLAICLCFTIVMRLIKYNDLELSRGNNPAAALVVAAAFVALAIMLKNAIYPSTALVQDFWFLEEKGFSDFAFILLRVSGNIVLTTLVSLFSIASALFVFQKFTKNIDEEAERSRKATWKSPLF